MGANICRRAKKTLFLSTPERHSYAATQRNSRHLENTKSFYHDGDIAAIVRRPGTDGPGVEVRADHHDLVAQQWIGSAQLTDHVRGSALTRSQMILHVDGNTYGDTAADQTQHPSGVFRRDEYDRR